MAACAIGVPALLGQALALARTTEALARRQSKSVTRFCVVAPDPKQTARILMAREQAARERREQAAQEARDTVAHVVARLVEPPARVWLIGSLGFGGFGPRSDVDLVLSAVAPERVSALEDALVRELGRTVDLLTLEELPESFQKRVLEQGARLL